MGTWGPGNFEDDAAAEYLSDFLLPLITQIEMCVSDELRMEPDEYDSIALFANLEIVACLGEQLGLGLAHSSKSPMLGLPTPEVVSLWRDRFLQVWMPR